MIPDDERREVARGLRCAAEQRQPYTEPTLACFIGAYCVDIWTRLADLIEPDTTTDTTKSPELTTKCDRDALLAVADELSEVRCDKRGELSITYGDLQGLARIIREALGVSDD